MWAKARNAISSRIKTATSVEGISTLQKELRFVSFHILHIEKMMAPLAAVI